MEYYCFRCKATITPIRGEIQHPDLGVVPALVCPKCGAQACPKDDKNNREAV